MPDNPLLILPTPTRVARSKLSGRGSPIHYPDHIRQKIRLQNKFNSLKSNFRQDRVELRRDFNGVEPEKVIVFDVIGSVDEFYKAVRNISGLEWLSEFDADEIDANEDFYVEGEPEDQLKSLSRRLYLVMTNQAGMTNLLGLWRAFKQDGGATFARGQAKWKHLFKQLNDVRLWGLQDRVLATGLDEDWRDRVSAGLEQVRVEIELWYRNQTNERNSMQSQLETAVQNAGGTVISRCQIEAIRYHAVLVELPITAVESLVKNQASILLAKTDPVMFFRPQAQSAFRFNREEGADSSAQSLAIGDQLPPLVGLIDGYPVENHSWLRDGLIVDDPDGISSLVPVNARHHGTAMASLILNGDDELLQKKLKRKIYCRPILVHRSNMGHDEEIVPEEQLSVDLIHRCVARMFRGDSGNPAAPTVKVVNLSIAERYRPFVNHMSPLARLIDWLSNEFNILFVISAGNQNMDVTVPLGPTAFEALPVGSRQKFSIQHFAKDINRRRLLSPAESINSVSVGAAYEDESAPVPNQSRIEILESLDTFSPLSPFGLGYRSSIKPDFISPGGKVFYSVVQSSPTETTYRPSFAKNIAPGNKVATPSQALGALNKFAYSCGTSNSAALTTRLAAQVLETLHDLNNNANLIPEEYWPCLTKALVTHGASWKEAKSLLAEAASSGMDHVRLKNWITRFVGYGRVEPSRSLFGEPHRATAIGYGSLPQEAAHKFLFPVPQSLSGVATLKRLVVTLAWISPIDCQNRKYRKSQLWFTLNGVNSEDPLLIGRQNVDWQTAKRGTLQHEIFEGSQISTFASDEQIAITVHHRSDAGKIDESLPYGIAVTLESADRVVLNVHSQVQARIRAQIRVQQNT